jgi:RHS repeat-associated protein
MIRDIDSPTGARQKLVFEYDHQGRRIRKQFFTRSGSNWVEQRDAICLYEGWNVVAELDANVSNARLRTYVWGLDLSGTRQGAGGVGGLLWVNNDQTSYGGQTLPIGVQYVAYDGNGNVVGLAKAADGTLSARYEYGPFGETVRQTGVLADAQPFRFSTKWTDVESGFLYYGYRYYNPSTGRWLNRDPIGQRGGRQPYSFLLNDALNSWDWLGLLRKGDKLDVSYHGKKIGHVTIESYFPNPTSGKREHRKDAIMVGAQLEAVVNIDCDCPGGYKWRQFITETRGTVATKSHTLDIGNRDAKRDGEWFKEHRTDNLSSICAYTFVDAPEQAADYRLELPSSNPDRIEKVTVTFTLELVRVDTRQTKSGGEILLTIEWGFWYTASANGLLNNDPVERKPPTKALE